MPTVTHFNTAHLSSFLKDSPDCEYAALVSKHAPDEVRIYKDVLADGKDLATSDT